MACLACGSFVRDPLCAPCRRTLVPASERRVGSVTVRPAFAHDGAARVLVHRLKYSGLAAAAGPLGRAMAALLPSDVAALVPVPRVTARRWSYGVDPALELARVVGRQAGVPVVDALSAAVWVRHRAGGAGRRRGVPSFSRIASVPAGAVLIDDVVTSGVTLSRAGDASGVRRAITATAGLRP